MRTFGDPSVPVHANLIMLVVALNYMDSTLDNRVVACGQNGLKARFKVCRNREFWDEVWQSCVVRTDEWNAAPSNY